MCTRLHPRATTVALLALATAACAGPPDGQTASASRPAPTPDTTSGASAAVPASPIVATSDTERAAPGASDSLRVRLARVAASLRPTTRVPFRGPLRVDGGISDDSLYVTVVSATPTAYELVLGVEEECDGGNWCRIGHVAGERLDEAARHPLPAGQPLTLSGGRRAVFVDATCGANCSDARVIWDEAGSRYTVGIKAARLERLRPMAESMTRLP